MALGAFMRGSMMLFIEKESWCNIIGIIVFSRGIDLRPVKFALIGDTRFVVPHAFSAFFFGVVQYFAVTTKFAIARIAL